MGGTKEADHSYGFNSAFQNREALEDELKEGTHTASDWGTQHIPEHGLQANDLDSESVVVTKPEFKPSKRLRPHLSDVLSEAHHIILSQLRCLREKAEAGEQLSPSEITAFAKLTDSLAKLDRTEREREKMADPAQQDTQELIDALPGILKALGK